MDDEPTVVRRPPLPELPLAAPLLTEAALEGTTLGHLRLDARLDRGASSDLYQGHNVLARKPCLVKVFRPALCANRVRWGRFVHESKTVAALRLPGVADVFDHQIIEGNGLVVMAPSQGNSLRELLKTSGPLSRRAFVPVIRAIGLALAQAHAAGIAHRRLHPGQVVVRWAGSEPIVQLLDFGVHHLHPPLTDEAAAPTAEQALWFAPEQIKGEPGDLRSDVYALGALLFRMITGRPPFVGESTRAVLDQHLSEPPPPPSRFAATPPEMEETVLRALEKDARKRTPSVEAMLAAIDPSSITGQHLLVRTSPKGLSPSPSREIVLASVGPAPVAVDAPAAKDADTAKDLRLPRQRRWLYVVAGVVVVLCLAVLAYVLLGDRAERAPAKPAPTKPAPRVTPPSRPGQPSRRPARSSAEPRVAATARPV